MKKRVKFAICTILVSVLLCAAIFGAAMLNYLHGTAKVTARDHVTASCGSTISLDDLAEFQNAVTRSVVSAEWESGGTDGLTIADDRQSLTIGDRSGVLEVTVRAKGTSAEAAESAVVRVTVGAPA